jgi:hypothetical protein
LPFLASNHPFDYGLLTEEAKADLLAKYDAGVTDAWLL